jgi:hypothetical protein
MSDSKIKTLPTVKTEDIGLYIRVISRDYKTNDNGHIAKLITENFGVQCYEKDVDQYENLYYHYQHEDFEKASREIEFGVRLEGTWN